MQLRSRRQYSVDSCAIWWVVMGMIDREWMTGAIKFHATILEWHWRMNGEIIIIVQLFLFNLIVASANEPISILSWIGSLIWIEWLLQLIVIPLRFAMISIWVSYQRNGQFPSEELLIQPAAALLFLELRIDRF